MQPGQSICAICRWLWYELFYFRLKTFKYGNDSTFLPSHSKLRQRNLHYPILLPRINSLSCRDPDLSRRGQTWFYLSMEEQRDSNRARFSLLLCHRLRNGANKIAPGPGIISTFIYETRFVYTLASSVANRNLHERKKKESICTQ